MFYEPARQDHGLAIDPFKAIVGPRPIAWISSQSADGVPNLAPHSFFNAFAESPHYVAFGSSGYKDTIANIRATGEFAVNVVTENLKDAMNLTSARLPAHVDEFDVARLSREPCRFIRPFRVAASPACLECRLFQIADLPDDDGHVDNWLVIGRVVGIHVDDSVIENGRVNTAGLKLVARHGYSDYSTVERTWQMRRPG